MTVLFCEICDFASISAKIPPSSAVALLSRVFQVFDQLVQRHGVHKVETVRPQSAQRAGPQRPSPALTRSRTRRCAGGRGVHVCGGRAG